jgi:two-component system sensor histidine kinase KdpD
MSISQNSSTGSKVPSLWPDVFDTSNVGFAGRHVQHTLRALALVGVVTIGLIGLEQAVELPHVSIVYLMPVLISAMRWGVFPAVVAALASMAASAFFFYPPIYSLQVHNPLQLIDLILFVFVAVVTGQLANNVRRHVAAAHERESEVRALYAFSRQLAVASAAPEIYAAIEDHLNLVLDRRVVLFEAMPEMQYFAIERPGHQVPDIVLDAVAKAMTAGSSGEETTIVDRQTGASWLIRAVSKTTTFGMVAIDVGKVSGEALVAMRRQVDAVLADASATLERLDLARAIGEAKIRTEADTFRDALIGSVSHELRTPLASIVGSTYVLANAPGVKQDTRLAELADDVRHEVERLNDDIQNLLDATRITSAGIKPHLQWTDVADIVNAAVERQERRLSSHRLELAVLEELPLVHADPLLIEQALGQILDNAAKYSPAGSSIRVTAAGDGAEIYIAVTDQGGGLTDDDRVRIWERFYRSPRHQESTPGSGLGLWVARAFVLASGGRIEAESPGPGLGTTVTIHLPAPRPTEELGGLDE